MSSARTNSHADDVLAALAERRECRTVAAAGLGDDRADVGAVRDLEHLGRADTVEGAELLLDDMEHEFQAVRHSLTAMLEKET